MLYSRIEHCLAAARGSGGKRGENKKVILREVRDVKIKENVQMLVVVGEQQQFTAVADMKRS
jgi:hypothetical protein